jgi:hypothetical protein
MRVPGINEPRFYGDSQPRNCRVEVRMSGRPASPPPTAAVAVSTQATAPVAPPAARIFPDPPPRVLPTPPPRATPPPPPPPGKPAPPAAATATAQAPRSLVRASVTFEPFSSVLDDPAIRALNGFVQPATRVMLSDTRSRIVVVSGIGTGEAGATAQRLSESRGGSVSAYLVSLGLPHNRIDISNQAQTGERRVDVSVVSP